ncbi:leucine-rich repeat-containing protein 52-like [Pimephales promelas]|uniref:leucine-rich repeat-containing protein 52-like n=2 Tax=Pimephales promelas TaxID=90988 RepID=UPI0019556F47|nr:leucine-rich repeat-containing protein 52-like [Pimephales promelas]
MNPLQSPLQSMGQLQSPLQSMNLLQSLLQSMSQLQSPLQLHEALSHSMCIGTQILLVLLVHVVSSIPSGCPERCVCDDQHVVQCVEQDLCRFPTGLPLTTRQLILSNNRISDLPALELNFLSDLMYLDCSNNSLTHISESTFANLRKLAYLDLSFNSLGKIEEQTFRALESLVMLRLTDNPRLSEFHPQAFPHTSAIQVLDISRNNLSRLNVSSLMALGGLRSLGLSGNPWLCACDTEELCLWMHTDTVKFQEEGQTVCEGPSFLRGQHLSELGLWLRRHCHPGLSHQDYLFFVAIGFVIFGVGTVLAWVAGMVIVLCQRCVRWRKARPNVEANEGENKSGITEKSG